jgi:hypothetical protein
MRASGDRLDEFKLSRVQAVYDEFKLYVCANYMTVSNVPLPSPATLISIYETGKFHTSCQRGILTENDMENMPAAKEMLDGLRAYFDAFYLGFAYRIMHGWTIGTKLWEMHYHSDGSAINSLGQELVKTAMGEWVVAEAWSHTRIVTTAIAPRIISIMSSDRRWQVQFRQLHGDAYALSWKLATQQLHAMLFTGLGALAVLLTYSLRREGR